MPIYEYQCTACQHELEVLQKVSDARLTLCPQCGRETLQKKVSAAGFRLKGGGWYETDFKSDKRKNLAGDSAAKGDAGGGESSGSGTKESGGKTESAAPAKSDSGSPATT